MIQKNNYTLLFLFIALLNYITSIYAENANYIVAIRRKKSDKYYDLESKNIQEKIDKLVNDRMNDIYEIIEENKDTYILENGEMDEQLKELENTSQLRKRSYYQKTKFFFINKTRHSKNINLKKRSYELEESNNLSNNSTVEYIPISSEVVDIICPIKNYYAIKVYLSDETKEIVCKLENVIYCEKIQEIDIENSNENDNEKKNKNKNSNVNKNKNKRDDDSKSNSLYYDINAIKNETNWSGVSVQSDAPKHLAVLSQSPFNDMNKFYDNNFYYPSSAGKGIDIYLVDRGLITFHDDYDTSSGRTITCDAIARGYGLEITTGDERYNCTGNGDYPNHGIFVTSLAGGTIYGVAKKANLHMIAMDFYNDSVLKAFDYIVQVAKPYKTVISLSFVNYAYSKARDDKLQELIDANFITVVGAANDNMNACEPPDSDSFVSNPGYRKTINIGGISMKLYGDGYYRINYSNYGDCVDFFAPSETICPDISNGSRNAYTSGGGTSYATPLVAGIIATVMSENPNTKFTISSMKKKLNEMSFKDAIYNIGSTDTPNRFINNGKRSLYSDHITNKCGKDEESKDGISCSEGCCSKEGVCLPYNIIPWKECYVENGCQEDYGKCFTAQEAIEKCDNELNENKKCLVNITSSLNNLDERLERCNNLKSNECETFFRKFINNLSYCNIAMKYKSYDFIENFDVDKYRSFMDICENNDYLKFRDRCKLENDKYKECLTINEFINFNDYSSFSKISENCYNITSNKCSSLYNEKENGLKKYLPNCYYSKNYHDIDFIKKWNNNTIFYNNPYEVYNQYKEICKNIPDKSVQMCNKILNENKECLLTKNSANNNKFNCQTFKSEKCQMFYKMYYNNGFVCNEAQKHSSFEFINSFDNDMYIKYQDECEMNNLWKNTKPRWIYNASSNKCLYAQFTINSVPILRKCINDASFKWYSNKDNSFSPVLNTKRYISILGINNLKIIVSPYNNDTTINFNMRDGMLYPVNLKDKENICLSVDGDIGIAFKKCNKNSNDQKWELWDEDPQEIKNVKTRTVYIYNRNLNKCMASGDEYTYRPKVVECNDIEKSKWEIPISGNGFFKSLYRGYCLNIKDINEGTIIMKECNENSIIMDIKSSINGKMIISSLHNNKCLGSLNPGDLNENRLNMNRCNESSDDQQWEIWDENPEDIMNAKTRTVWIYNRKLNRCMASGDSYTYRPKIVECSDVEKSKWEIPVSGNGFFKSLYRGYCLNIKDINEGTTIMKECNENSIIMDIKSSPNGKMIISSLDDNKCLGSLNPSNPNEIRLNMNECNESSNDQQWEIWDTNPADAYQTVWIYNKKLEKCIYSNGEKSSRPVYGVCYDKNISEWKIHYSAIDGDGYFKSVYNNLCMVVSNINNGKVIMGDCNDDAIFTNIKKSYNKESLMSIKSTDKCLGSYNPNNLKEDRLLLRNCDKNDIYQHWEIRTENPGEIKCGKGNKNRKCPNSQCCSRKSYCGITDAYCGKGCQSGLCNK